MTPTPTPSLPEVIAVLGRWLTGAREQYLAGRTVLVTMSPGEGTRYSMLFIPPGVPEATTYWKGKPESPILGRSESVLVNLQDKGSTASIIGPGCPTPWYVAEKLGLSSTYEQVAFGLVWAVMLGHPAEVIASHFAVDVTEQVVARWKLANFEAS